MYLKNMVIIILIYQIQFLFLREYLSLGVF